MQYSTVLLQYSRVAYSRVYCYSTGSMYTTIRVLCIYNVIITMFFFLHYVAWGIQQNDWLFIQLVLILVCCSRCYFCQPILDYINGKNAKYISDNSKLKENNILHCCFSLFIFISWWCIYFCLSLLDDEESESPAQETRQPPCTTPRPPSSRKRARTRSTASSR